MELMQTLDDAWNSQDWATFEKRHKVDAVVRWPGQPPMHGVHDHRAESIQFFETFPDNHLANGTRIPPYGQALRGGLLHLPILTFTATDPAGAPVGFVGLKGA